MLLNNDLTVNADYSIHFGKDQMKNFQKSLPGVFYYTINGKVKTMIDGRKGMKAGKTIMLDPEIIYTCALAPVYINTDLDFEKPLVYKLAS